MKRDNENILMDKNNLKKAGIRDGIFNDHNFVNDMPVLGEKNKKPRKNS